MAIVFSNNARTTLASNISNSATTITVADGSVFPSLTGGDIFYCTIDDGTNNEIVEVTARSGNTLTVVRAQDNTTARAFVTGDLIELRLVAKVLETFPQLDVGELTADEFVGDLRGAVIFKAQAGEAVSKGDAVYVSGISGNTPVVSLADADFASKMPAFGLVLTAASTNGSTEVVTFGTISGIDTSAFSVGDTLYISTTAGELTNSKPTGEASLIQNIGKVQRSHASAGSIKVGGAGRTNDVPNLNDGNIFIGNASNQATTATLDTSIVPENTNLYYTDARAQAVSINNVVEDTTPQLGGDLDLNSNNITGTGDINITGTVTSDGLTVDGDTDFIHTTPSNVSTMLTLRDNRTTTSEENYIFALNRQNSVTSALYLGNNDSNNAIIAGNNTATLIGYDVSGIFTPSAKFNNNGDISFYEDTGTTAKLFWDASAESLGIGLTNPSEKLEVSGKIKASGQIRSGSYLESFPSFSFADDTDTGMYRAGTNALAFATGGTERWRITSSGTLQGNNATATFNYTGDAIAIKSLADGTTPVGITFTSQGVSGTQIGHVRYTHRDALSYDSNESFTIGGTESTTTILADGKLMFKEGLYLKPSSGTGAGTQIIDSSRNLLNIGTISSGAITATGTVIVDGGTGVSSSGVFHVRQNGDGDGNGIAITSSNATSHRIWKNASGVLNIGSSSNTNAFQQDLTGNITIEGTIDSGAITSTSSITGRTGTFTGQNGTALEVNSGTTNVVAKFESGDATAWINLKDSNSGTYGTLLGAEGGLFRLRTNNNDDTTDLTVDTSGNLSVSGTINSGAIISTGEVEATALDINGNGDISGNLTLGGYLAGPATFTIDPAAVGNNTGTVVIAGNLQVDGTTTTVNSTTVNVSDKAITLGYDATTDAANNLAGIVVYRPETSNAQFLWSETNERFEINRKLNISRQFTVDASGTNDTMVEIGAGTASNHYAYIDLIGDATYTDYGMRIIRNNGGANTSSFIYHRGTGNFNIETQDSAAIKLRTAGADALTITSSQNADFAGTITVPQLDLRGQAETSNLDTVGRGLYYWGSTQPSTGSPGFNYGVAWTVRDPNQNIQLAFGSSGAGRLAVRRADSGTYYDWTHFYGESTTISGDVSSSYNQSTNTLTLTVADDSHNHVISNVDGLQTALDSKYESGDNVSLGTISSGNITTENVHLERYQDGTVSSNVGRVQLIIDGKTGWDIGDELGSIDWYTVDGSGIGQRNVARIVGVNNQGNGSTTTAHEGELEFYTSAYNTAIGSTPVLKLDGDQNATFAGTVTASGGNSTNWNTAYGWGDHSTEGYLTDASTQTKYLRSDTSDTYSGGTLTIQAPANGTGVFITKALDSPDEPAALVIASDADAQDDLAFEIRGNATGTSVDLSTTMSSTDTTFAVFANGHTTIGYNSLGTSYAPVNAYGLNVNGTISSVSGYYVGSTQVINSSGNWVSGGTISSGAITSSDSITLEAGGLILGEDAYSASTQYVGMKSALMTGANDYMIISAQSTAGDDGHTYISAKDAQSVHIRGGGNNSSNQIVVPDDSYISMETSNLRFNGNLQAGTTTVIDSSRNLTNIGTISSGVITTTGDMTIQSTGSVGLTINADTDNITESHVPHLSFKMDGSQERFRLGVDSANQPYISTNSDIALPLNIKTGTSDTIAMTLDGSQNVSIPNGTLTTNSITTLGTITVDTDLADAMIDLKGDGSYDSVLRLRSDQGDITTEGFEIWYDNSVGDVHLNTTFPNDAAAIHFQTRTGAAKSTANKRLTINGDGNVDVVTGSLRLLADGTDLINFTATSTNNDRGIAFNDRSAITSDSSDGWLRLNQNSEFSNGVYTPANLRVDGSFYITNKIIHEGDANTYIGFPANDQFNVFTAGAERLKITSTDITITEPLGDNNTFLTLKQENTASDISTQETFIDFVFIDSNANNYPQVKIGAQVGQNADANSTIKEGSGAFVVHTSNPVDSTAGGQAGMAERFRVDYQGDVTATGNITAYSDERLKDNIETLDGSKVYEMRGVSFTKEGREGSGVIAQEIEEIAPELVITAGDEMGTKSVAYGNLVGYLIEAIKEQQETIEKLTSRINDIEKGE